MVYIVEYLLKEESMKKLSILSILENVWLEVYYSDLP